MKKLILLGLCILLACSNDDDSSKPENSNWTIRIQDECPDGEQTHYCVTEETWNDIDDSLVVVEVCNWVSFRDINGDRHSGYFRSAGTGTNACE